MNVYVIEYNIREAWEDDFSWIGEVFLDVNKAENYLLSQKFNKSIHPPMNRSVSEYDKKINEFDVVSANIYKIKVEDDIV